MVMEDTQKPITIALYPAEIQHLDVILKKHGLREGHMLRQVLRFALDAWMPKRGS